MAERLNENGKRGGRRIFKKRELKGTGAFSHFFLFIQ